jgi:hypothetical protein
MNPYLAFTLGVVFASAMQVAWAIVQPTKRFRKRDPFQRRAVAAVRAGEVVEVTQHYDGDGRETVIRLIAPSRSTTRVVRR